MNVEEAYDQWSSQYDSNANKTRDLEATALRDTLKEISFSKCLEIGCGTGKNTSWLITKARSVTAVDLSAEMLTKAKEKIVSSHVQFIQADIRLDWTFGNSFDLISFSLVLEHIENLETVFKEAVKSLVPGGHIYIGELHPFKQYTGTKARFDTENGQQIVDCFNHHISDFIKAAKQCGLTLVDINEYFDNDDRSSVPRILTVVFRLM
jgi:ubiquinone/menaquinone biosynthesis C-methylase UbiE